MTNFVKYSPFRTYFMSKCYLYFLIFIENFFFTTQNNFISLIMKKKRERERTSHYINQVIFLTSCKINYFIIILQFIIKYTLPKRIAFYMA